MLPFILTAAVVIIAIGYIIAYWTYIKLAFVSYFDDNEMTTAEAHRKHKIGSLQSTIDFLEAENADRQEIENLTAEIQRIKDGTDDDYDIEIGTAGK